MTKFLEDCLLQTVTAKKNSKTLLCFQLAGEGGALYSSNLLYLMHERKPNFTHRLLTDASKLFSQSTNEKKKQGWERPNSGNGFKTCNGEKQRVRSLLQKFLSARLPGRRAKPAAGEGRRHLSLGSPATAVAPWPGPAGLGRRRHRRCARAWGRRRSHRPRAERLGPS